QGDLREAGTQRFKCRVSTDRKRRCHNSTQGTCGAYSHSPVAIPVTIWSQKSSYPCNWRKIRRCVKKPIQKQKRRLIAKSASLLHYRKNALPVLKTSGTTGHLPSPAMFSITYGRLVLCLSIRLSICEVPKAAATSSSFILR